MQWQDVTQRLAISPQPADDIGRWLAEQDDAEQQRYHHSQRQALEGQIRELQAQKTHLTEELTQRDEALIQCAHGVGIDVTSNRGRSRMACRA